MSGGRSLLTERALSSPRASTVHNGIGTTARYSCLSSVLPVGGEDSSSRCSMQKGHVHWPGPHADVLSRIELLIDRHLATCHSMPVPGHRARCGADRPPAACASCSPLGVLRCDLRELGVHGPHHLPDRGDLGLKVCWIRCSPAGVESLDSVRNALQCWIYRECLLSRIELRASPEPCASLKLPGRIHLRILSTPAPRPGTLSRRSYPQLKRTPV